MDKKLKKDLIQILTYFKNGLSDIQEGSGEEQPMLKEIKSALFRVESGAPYKEYCDCNYRNTSVRMADGHVECSNCWKEIKTEPRKENL